MISKLFCVSYVKIKKSIKKENSPYNSGDVSRGVSTLTAGRSRRITHVLHQE